MSKILITGGAGFIGSAVVKYLQQFDHEIFVIDDLSFGNRKYIHIDDDHFFKMNILDRQNLFKRIKTVAPEKVIHLAAVHFIPYCNQHPFESANINIQGTMNVLAASKATGVRQVFFASTAAVYPISSEAVSETSETGPMDIYGLSKLACEGLCHEFFLETNITTIICRFFNAFGPNETNPHLIPEIQRQINERNRTIKLGNMTPKRDFIHTYDMAEAVLVLLENLNSGYHIFNLGRGIEYSVTEIVESFEKQLGEKIFVEIDPSRVRKVERMHLLADVTKLQKLGWRAKINIDEGIATLIKK
jgi:UDP-glucose 4-epimerase